jgi:predicted RNA-binding Zn-ribbon protein involved in translation (DUF1610 family)
MNEKLQRLANKMIGLFSEDFKSAQDCYDRFRNVYKQQFDYFQNFDPSNILKLVLYIYSFKNTGDFKLAENILNKSGFASLFIMESDYLEVSCEDCGGDGLIRCRFCDRNGNVECDNCGGSGRVDCYECN